MISLDKEPVLILQKLMFTFLLGAFLSVVAQFSCERFERLRKMRLPVYFISALLILGYYLIISPAPSISFSVKIRTVVAVFAMFCAFIWLPSLKDKADFNNIALIHFKAAFTSVLYAAVLSAGCTSIIAAIDILLFKVNQNAYPITLCIIWIFFADLYYLSLLPRFNSESEADLKYAEHAAIYPRLLEILISYIVIPLIAVYSIVLTAYFIKILVTLKWPAGQLGPMILAYSAVGLITFILSNQLKNKFTLVFRLVFPKALILMVIMQLISVVIRVNAYGITESRYYVILFGMLSLACGILFSFKPAAKNGFIALLAAGLAILSVIPPVDAFTVSRCSQIARLENMLRSEGVLSKDGKIIPKSAVPVKTRLESTRILDYLETRNYLKYINWLPADFKIKEMKDTFGFDAAYEDWSEKYFGASLDTQKPIEISGYDIFIHVQSYTMMDDSTYSPYNFQVRNNKYKLIIKRISPQEVNVSVNNSEGIELVSSGLYSLASALPKVNNTPKGSLSPELMTLDVQNNGYKLRIILLEVNINYGTDKDPSINYDFLVLFGEPSK
ncbi:MAG TPA: DUF4153 domain-containing protein [Desulfotomaculum sp.]|nr:MAG: hypothetical protein XD84_1894 [Desulfotomaculum sp. 46_80]HAG12214.1 DUF4153 domain-containing protein [Desulfotomaculum sp.]HBY04103.1 DUF4153 domain-containing protein [Desulfotomaculum sp.]